MKTEAEVREQLDSVLREHEPPLAITPADLRRRVGRARRMRRRFAVAAITGAVAASVAFGVGGGILGGHPDQVVVTPTPETFNPDELVAAMTAHAHAIAPEGWTTSRDAVVASDAQSNEISGSDRDKASKWDATFDFGPHSVLVIGLRHVSDGDAETQRKYCDNSVESGETVTCDLTVREDGTVVKTTVSGMTRQDGAWPVVWADQLGERPDSLWFERAVRVYGADGSLTLVEEMTKAPTLREAEDAWLASPDELTSIAFDPALRYPAPPAGLNGCDWIVPEKREWYHCGAVAKAAVPAEEMVPVFGTPKDADDSVPKDVHLAGLGSFRSETLRSLGSDGTADYWVAQNKKGAICLVLHIPGGNKVSGATCGPLERFYETGLSLEVGDGSDPPRAVHAYLLPGDVEISELASELVTVSSARDGGANLLATSLAGAHTLQSRMLPRSNGGTFRFIPYAGAQ